MERSKFVRSRSLVWVLMVPVALAVMVAFSWSDEAVSSIEGRKLYEKHCAGCHGDLAETAKGGRSMNRIRTAIRTMDQHKQFSTLSDEQLLLIAVTLKNKAD
ncbi:MAG: cytochrome c [Nitrospirota bacterium]